MPRLNYVQSARPSKRQRRCHGCGKDINVGDPYKWFANKVGRSSLRKDFCATCRVRPSQMTTSPHLSALYSAQEAAEDALGSFGNEGALADYGQIVRDYGEAVREVGEGYRESAQAIEDGFGHSTYQCDELNEKADNCDSFADECDNAADEIESLDDPDDDQLILDCFVGESDGEVDEEGKPVDDDEWEAFSEAKRTELREAAQDAADQAISELPEV